MDGMESVNTARLLAARQEGRLPAARRALQFTRAHVLRLREAAVLSGHGGCINRLHWSERGDALASGSDDRQARATRARQRVCRRRGRRPGGARSLADSPPRCLTRPLRS
jgi:WD40 repeat protein